MGHQVMGHQVRPHQAQAWRSGDGERAWLSLLIDTMEHAALPGVRAVPCDRKILSALKVQLALPAAPYAYRPAQQASDFSLRN
jgi:hypothetical protein